MAVCSYYYYFGMFFLTWMIKNNHNLSEGHLAWKSFIMINGAEIREFVYPKNLLCSCLYFVKKTNDSNIHFGHIKTALINCIFVKVRNKNNLDMYLSLCDFNSLFSWVTTIIILDSRNMNTAKVAKNILQRTMKKSFFISVH